MKRAPAQSKRSFEPRELNKFVGAAPISFHPGGLPGSGSGRRQAACTQKYRDGQGR